MNFVFDLDGTICFKGVPVSERIIKALKELEDAGHTIIFASARPIRDMLPVIDECFHRNTLIGGNGALLSEEGHVTFAKAFSIEQVEYIKKWINDHHATYLIDGEWDYSYTGSSDHPILNNLDPQKRANNIDIEHHRSIVKSTYIECRQHGRIITRTFPTRCSRSFAQQRRCHRYQPQRDP
jgi:HAD superfamily hydrolase (TIGR01484 family)